jgi:HSP20 family protein
MSNLDFWRNSWNPNREATAFSRAIDKIFEEWPVGRMGSQETGKYVFSPNFEVTEDKNAYYLKVDVPGVPKDSIKIDLHDNRLSVSGERKEEKKVDDKESRTHFSEIYYGSFSRSITFPVPVDAEKTEAKYDAGVLNLVIAKKTALNSRQIAIK